MEDYKSAIIKLHRNRDFLVYFFWRKQVSKKFEKVKGIMTELREGKEAYDREHQQVLDRADTTDVIRGWLDSYAAYLDKVLAHVAIVEQLQPLYELSWREKIEKGERIQKLLDQLDIVVKECQAYGDRANDWVRKVNECSRN